jgi:hypothetical protein
VAWRILFEPGPKFPAECLIFFAIAEVHRFSPTHSLRPRRLRQALLCICTWPGSAHPVITNTGMRHD